MRGIIKKVLLLLILLFVFLPTGVRAQNEVNIHYFWGVGCPYCNSAKITLDELVKEYKNITVYDYEIYNSAKNRQIFKDVGKLLNEDVAGVPFMVIGKETIVGFNTATTPNLLKQIINYYSQNAYQDIVGEMLGIVDTLPPPTMPDPVQPPPTDDEVDEPTDEEQGIDNDSDSEGKINLPLIGEIDANTVSLPVITVIIGLIDGFNPCALWILLLLISVLIGMNDRRKMFILGFTFILASAVIYYLFMAAWLQVLLFIGALFWIRLFIALVALLGGIYNLRAYFQKINGGCKIVNEHKRNKIFDRIKKFTHEKNLFLAIIGIILLAISVNFIELLCSAGLPLVYTKILTMNEVSPTQYYLYLLMYVFFFMLDHIIIFTIAMVTFKLKGISTTYTKYGHLIGGILMIIIGILMYFKPEWLLFG